MLLPAAPSGDATRYHGHGTRLGEQIRRLWQTMNSYPQLRKWRGFFCDWQLTLPRLVDIGCRVVLERTAVGTKNAAAVLFYLIRNEDQEWGLRVTANDLLDWHCRLRGKEAQA